MSTLDEKWNFEVNFFSLLFDLRQCGSRVDCKRDIVNALKVNVVVRYW